MRRQWIKFFATVVTNDDASRPRQWPTASTNSFDRRRRCLSATTHDVNERWRSLTTLITSDGVDNGTPAHRNNWGYYVSSLTMTPDDVNDWWQQLLVRQLWINFIFRQLSTKRFQFATISRIKLYFTTIKLDRIRSADNKFAQKLLHEVNASKSREVTAVSREILI